MKSSSGIACSFMIFICLIFSFRVYAQPDAGTILREHSPPDTPLPDRIPQDRETGPGTASSPTGSGKTALVKDFMFTGHEDIAADAELREQVKDSVNKELGLSDLQRIASSVTDYLRDEKGYFLARAYLPEQDITEGIIQIIIIPGQIEGKVRIDIAEPSRIDPSLLEGIAEGAVPEGGSARLENIERAILLMNDLPGIDARASIEPGETTGSSRIVVKASEGKLFKGVISSDNHGDRYTGAYRAAGMFSLLDPSGLGDSLNVSVKKADRLRLLSAGYGLPLGSTGFTFNTSYTDLSYELGKDLTDLRAEGEASSITADIGYPLLRSRKASLWAGTGLEYLTLGDEANGARTSDREILGSTVFLSGNFSDGYFGGGLTGASLVLTSGDADLSGLASSEAVDLAGARTSGGFWKGSYSVARLQRVTGLVSFYGSLRGQLASGNLDSSQKFVLGGPGGVRAYPVGEASGDEGHLFTFEVRIDLSFMPSWATAQLTGFFDTGRIRQHKDPWPWSLTNTTDKNEYGLSGAGIGLNIAKEDLYRINVCYAREIGSNDGETLVGKDSDNLCNDGRFWLDLTIRF